MGSLGTLVAMLTFLPGGAVGGPVQPLPGLGLYFFPGPRFGNVISSFSDYDHPLRQLGELRAKNVDGYFP